MGEIPIQLVTPKVIKQEFLRIVYIDYCDCKQGITLCLEGLIETHQDTISKEEIDRHHRS